MPQTALRFVRSLFALALALVAIGARAECNDADRVFQKGLEAMRAGDYEAACPLLEESYRLDPVPGALFTLAECETAWGRLAAAVTHYRAFLEMVTSLPPARRDRFEERRRIAVEKVATVSASMPEITVNVPAGASGLVVKRNGAAIDASSYGVTQKVDPGEYVFAANAPGAPAWERRYRLGERDKVHVDVPWPLGSAGGRAPAQEPSAPRSIDDALADAPSRSPSRTWVYVAGAVGLAGIATGTVAGIMAISSKSDIDANCPNRLCNAQGQRALETGRTTSLVSTIAFPIGAAGLATAAVLMLLSPSKTERGAARVRPAVVAGPGGTGLFFEGAF